MTSAKGRYLTKLFIAVNGLFWLLFWGIFFFSSHKAVPVWPPTDGAVIVAGRACDLLAPMNPQRWFAYMAIWPNAPTWVVARPVFKMVLDFYRFGMNLSGTRLVFVCLVSFLQWYLIGRGIGWLMSRRQQHVDAAAR